MHHTLTSMQKNLYCCFLTVGVKLNFPHNEYVSKLYILKGKSNKISLKSCFNAPSCAAQTAATQKQHHLKSISTKTQIRVFLPPLNNVITLCDSLSDCLSVISLSVQRRLSVQLPILHHSYLPTVGGVSYSSSSLFGSQEAFVHHGVEVTHPVQLRGRSCSHVTD